MRNFWAALRSVVHGSFDKVGVFDMAELLWMSNYFQAESALSLVQDREDSETHIHSPSSPVEPLDVPDANLIIRSSDLVNFRIHKSVLAIASPFFKALFSLPQPPDDESVDGLPVVQLSEDAELLNKLGGRVRPVEQPLHP